MMECSYCGEELKQPELTDGRCLDCSTKATVNKKDLESLVEYSLLCTQFLFDAGYEGKSKSLAAKANIVDSQIS